MAREELRDKLLEIAKVDTLEELSGIIDEMSPEEEELFKDFLDKKQEIRDFYNKNNGNLNTIENNNISKALKAERQELFDKIVKNVNEIPVHESVKDWKEIRKDAENRIDKIQAEIDDLNDDRRMLEIEARNCNQEIKSQEEKAKKDLEDKKMTQEDYDQTMASLENLKITGPLATALKELENNSREIEKNFDELQAAQMIALHAKTMQSQARAMAFTEAIKPHLDLIQDKAIIFGNAFKDVGKTISQGFHSAKLSMTISDQQRSSTWVKNTREAVHNIIAKAHLSSYQKSSQKVDKAWEKAMKKAAKYNKKAEKAFKRKDRVNQILEKHGRAPKYKDLELDKKSANDFIKDVHVGLFRKSYEKLQEINNKDLEKMIKSFEKVNNDRNRRIKDQEKLQGMVQEAAREGKISERQEASFEQDLKEFNSVSKEHEKILDQVMQNIEDKVANIDLGSSDIVNFVNEYAKIKGEDPNKLMDGLKENQEKILKEREGVEFER